MATDLVIILSSDWVASTATRARLGEDRADHLQELHDTLIRRAIDAVGGKVVKHSGDGVLAIFHSATAALAAASDIQGTFAKYRESPEAEAPIDVRVGLAAGDVKHQTGDIFGLPVIEAVRLQSAAQPNETLCSDLVRILSQGRGGFEFEDAGTHELKGLPQPVRALRVRRADMEAAPAARPGSVTPAPGAARAAPFLRRPAAVVGMAAVVGIVLLGLADPLGWRTASSVASSVPEVAGAAASTEPLPPPGSIAVIPFINLSPREEDSYFAVGIHEEILNQLAKLGGLHVLSRTTVQRYANTDKSIAEIARELNVATVMEGSVRYAEGRVLVTTQLIDGRTDAHLWSEAYEREFSNIFAIQAEIALNVARAMETELLPSERARIERPPTGSLAAYNLYLSAVARDGRQNRDDTLAGIDELDRALAIDPQFVLAWARKATLCAVAPFFDPQATAAHLENGERAARRAIELDPSNGRAQSALGFILFQLQDWIGSELAFRRAIELGESLASMASYSVLNLSVGNFARARDVLEQTRAEQPQNPTALAFLMTAAALLGDWESAVSHYEAGASLFPSWHAGSEVMIALRLARGERESARAIPPHEVNLGNLLALLDESDERLRAELRTMATNAAFADPLSQRLISVWAATFGEPELALSTMRAATTQGGNALFVWLPQFREARQLPEFKTLLRDLGIVRYWEEFGWQSVCRPLAAGDFECD